MSDTLPPGMDHHKVGLFVDDEDNISVMDSLGNIRKLQSRGIGPWHYVGTPDQVEDDTDIYGTPISDLIASNPPPYNADPWIPFKNSWNNSLGNDAPISFRVDSGWLVIRGGGYGGSANTVIFTLPVEFRPFYQQPLIAPTTASTDNANADVLANGDVVFNQDN